MIFIIILPHLSPCGSVTLSEKQYFDCFLIPSRRFAPPKGKANKKRVLSPEKMGRKNSALPPKLQAERLVTQCSVRLSCLDSSPKYSKAESALLCRLAPNAGSLKKHEYTYSFEKDNFISIFSHKDILLYNIYLKIARVFFNFIRRE